VVANEDNRAANVWGRPLAVWSRDFCSDDLNERSNRSFGVGTVNLIENETVRTSSEFVAALAGKV
jgi:hypothetical protein